MIRIGVIGGGQLARMMTPAALELGLEIRVFAESHGQSAGLATTTIGDYKQLEQLREFAESVDVLTFDHEHVPISHLEQLVKQGHRVHPGPHALQFAQNKLLMRQRLSKLNLPMPKWAEIRNPEQLQHFLDEHSVAIVKTPIGGYDGKGVRVVSEISQVSDWFDRIENLGGSLLAEEKVNFVREIAVLSARNESGDFSAWKPVQTTQRNSVCHEVVSPAPNLKPEDAIEIARVVSEQLSCTGVLAVEMFETFDGKLLINELAMRPHNSGHFSLDASITSQFEQHLRAVADLPLGDSAQLAPWAVMLNLLGTDSESDFRNLYSVAMRAHPDVKFHSYAKLPRPGRKMGHLTVIGDDLEQIQRDGHSAAKLLGSE